MVPPFGPARELAEPGGGGGGQGSADAGLMEGQIGVGSKQTLIESGIVQVMLVSTKENISGAFRSYWCNLHRLAN